MPRVLAIDPGERRIGLALSDETGLVARPVMVLRRRSLRETVASIVDFIRTEGVAEVLVGVPVSLGGQIGPQARRSIRFAAELQRTVPVPVRTWNEQYSTLEGQRRLIESGRGRRDRKRMLDAAAAAVILQEYLDTRS